MAFVIILVLAFSLWMSVRIVQKAGLSAFWAITQVIPVVNIIMIWVFAFSRWPAIDDGPQLPSPPDGTISGRD
jgi:predicted PurR-regulated permease PerM